jgi:hypothetical protein
MPATGRGAGAGGSRSLGEVRTPLGVMSALAQLPHRLLSPLAWVVLLVSAVVALLSAAPHASAEEVFTGQAASVRATDSTWVTPSGRRPALCIVDTGVGAVSVANPDLSNVVARFAVDGGTPDDLSDGHHGTLMAMIASAPRDGFGMVGVAPMIDVVSVRASRDGATFGSQDLTTAIRLCINKRTAYNIKVISLSLGGPVSVGLDQVSMAATEDAVENARRSGLAVVAAAGNHLGAVDWPAGYGPVLAVGAADTQGAMCSFAASGPEVDVWAPGCPLDVAVPDGRPAWASGSSESAAIVAAVLAQLRGLRPELDVDPAEGVLTGHARPSSAGPFLDVDIAFRAAGLADALAAGHGAIPVPVTAQPSSAGREPVVQQPAASVPTTGPATAAPSTPVTEVAQLRPPSDTALPRLLTPHIRSITQRGHVLSIRFKAKPKGARARVVIYSRTKGQAFPRITRTLSETGDSVRTRVSGTVTQVSITYGDTSGARRSSVTLTLRPKL